MFLATIIVSIVTGVLFIQVNQGKDNAIFRLATAICFVFSWLIIAMWFTILTEAWQLALDTPAASSELIPAWGRVVQNLLHRVVFVLPVSRLTLGVLYALPILLIPLILAVVRRPQMMSLLLYSTSVNLLFFWMQLIVDNWTRIPFMKIPIQGTILLTTYVLVIYALIRPSQLTLAGKE